jgi:hypothetical protein
MTIRRLTTEEKSLLASLLNNAAAPPFKVSLDAVLASPYDDGGMGSLQLFPTDASTSRQRHLGKEIARGMFKDRDGVDVSVTVNVDDQGELYELDIWKVDSSPLLRWPCAEDVMFDRIPGSSS